MFVHNIDPVIFSIGPIQVRYYGLAYLIGFLLAYWFLARASRENRLNLSRQEVDDYIFWILIGVVAGGRLGYFLFYNISAYWTEPLRVLMIWTGGMSFHGGLLGAVAVTWWFVKKHDVSFYRIADIAALPVAIALGIGRIANFINGEIVGTGSSLPWCVQFRGYEGCRHPVQLYLSLKNFAVAGLLWWLDHTGQKGQQKGHEKQEGYKDGFLFWNLVFWYGIGRFLVDFVRAEPRFLGVSMGQYLSLAMVIAGGWMLWTKYIKKS